MGNEINYRKIISVIGIFLIWGFIGIVLAYFWGLGWFFLIITVRRILISIPYLRKLFQRVIGIDMNDQKTENPPKEKQISEILGLIIIVAWLAMTIFVFAKVNIPLYDLFRK
jgi:hypothetical protein